MSFKLLILAMHSVFIMAVFMVSVSLMYSNHDYLSRDGILSQVMMARG